MSHHASGTFDVKITPQDTQEKTAGATLGRSVLDKRYHGELEATAKGEMLTAISSETKGSAVYVAVEHVTGRLQGREGAFALVHKGTMSGGTQQLSINVTPDSGSGGLVGLSGQMQIRIADGKHFYDFEYTLPATA
jgi:hypothetical protein